MNFRDQDTIRAPSGKDDVCAVFTIDTTDEPFVLQDIVEVGQKYTLSFHARSESSGGISVANNAMAVGTDWKRYVVTFAADGVDLPIYFTATGTYYLYNTQLEVGNKDTDFALNPADTEQSLDDLTVVVNNHSTQFSIMDGRISALITEDATIRGEYDTLVKRTTEIEADLTGITSRVALNENDLNDANRRLTEAESTIVQQAGEIALTVKEQDVTGNYVIGKINLDSTTAKISAKNIDLSGYVTISSLKTAGATTIDGSNITTGLISADRIDADALMTKKLTATNLTVTGNSKFSGVLDGATGTFSGSLNAASGTFTGELKGASGSFAGSITAESGKVGGWIIDSDSIYSNYSSNRSGMCSNAGKYAFWAGETNSALGAASSNAVFRVGHNGSLLATNATITGGITATELIVYDVLAILQNGETSARVALNASSSTGVASLNIGGGFGQVVAENYLIANNGLLVNGDAFVGTLHAGGSMFSDAGFIELSGDTPFIDFHYGSMSDVDYTSRIIANTAGGLSIVCTMGEALKLNDRAIVPGQGASGIRGNGDNAYACGHSSYRWTAVYAKNGTIQTSDEREKHFLDDLKPTDLHEVFMALQPKAFTWLTGEDHKIHLGVGAQSAERCLERYGYDPERFSMVQRDKLETPSDLGLTDRYSMDYQFINMLTLAETQQNSRDIEDMQVTIEYLLDENAKLKKELKELKQTA